MSPGAGDREPYPHSPPDHQSTRSKGECRAGLSADGLLELNLTPVLPKTIDSCAWGPSLMSDRALSWHSYPLYRNNQGNGWAVPVVLDPGPGRGVQGLIWVQLCRHLRRQLLTDSLPPLGLGHLCCGMSELGLLTSKFPSSATYLSCKNNQNKVKSGAVSVRTQEWSLSVVNLVKPFGREGRKICILTSG